MKPLWIFALFSASLYALPQNGTIAAGDALLTQNNGLLEIRTKDRTILNWESFSIQNSEIARFIQPSERSAVLNCVVGSEISHLIGLLHSNGQVYLINPNGIIIGRDAKIDTASFIASTHPVSREEFLNGGDLQFKGNSTASITLLGTIESFSGPVAL